MVKTLKNGTRVEFFRAAIVIYDFADGDQAEVSQIVSAHPGQAVAFLSTTFTPTVFSQAENTQRTFVFLRGAVDESEVDPAFPAQWLSPGDFIPAIPGNISVEATQTALKAHECTPD